MCSLLVVFNPLCWLAEDTSRHFAEGTLLQFSFNSWCVCNSIKSLISGGRIFFLFFLSCIRSRRNQKQSLSQFDFSRSCHQSRNASFDCLLCFLFAFRVVGSRSTFVYIYSGHSVPLFICMLYLVRAMKSRAAISSARYYKNICFHVFLGSKTDANCGTFRRHHDRFRRGSCIRGKFAFY